MNLGARIIARLAIASLALGAAAAFAGELDDQLRLNTSITVTGDAVHLGDIFSGYLSRPEKVVAQAPRPGQRLVLSAEWLDTLARTYGLNWHPANAYDRATVYQPGRSIMPHDILAAIKAELVSKGMPANFSVNAGAWLAPVTVAATMPAEVGVREATFDPASRTFSAVVEIPPGDPKAQFLPLHGIVFPAVSVPTLKENAAKNTIITAAMVTMVELPEDQVKATTVTDPAMVVGKGPKGFLKAGLPIQESELVQVTLVDVPVLSTNLVRESTIAKDQIKYVTLSEADLPHDAIVDPSQLIGRTLRRALAAGAPIRRGDVELVRKVRVPVVARELGRGVTLTADDLNWVTMNENEVVANVITDETAIVDRVTKHAIRAGQTLRTFDIARPIAVDRSSLVTIIYSAPLMNLTVQGQALEPGGIGDVIRVANTKSKTTVAAVVIDARTVRVTAQQTAMR